MSIAILGAGSWGTAVAIHLAHHKTPVLLWTHNAQEAKKIQHTRVNKRYLPDIMLPSALEVTHDLARCLNHASIVIMAVPSHAFTSVLERIDYPPCAGLAWLTKGLEPQTHQFLSDIVAHKWGYDYPMAIISGPSFAAEVARFLPTALTLASNQLSFAHKLQHFLHQGHFRVYTSQDLIGVQLAGAVKNVLAIACGISDGLNFGANAKAALITRGLAEMRRLGIALGATDETFSGLAGLGDLVLTCTDNQSRNRRFGLQLGQGVLADVAKQSISQVIEGIHNAKQVCALATQYNIDMPICREVAALLFEGASLQQILTNLMSRTTKTE